MLNLLAVWIVNALALLAQAAVQLERAGDVEGCLTALDRLAFGRLQR